MTTLTREELLDILKEEAGEVIVAASKCSRFGFDVTHEGYGHNARRLAREYGQLIAIAEALDLDPAEVEAGRAEKLPKAMEAKRLYGVRRP